MLLLLLRSARGAFVVILALPLSILLTFTVLRVAGIDANLMSLGGLAISIGMIIDATIIQVENVQRRLGRARGDGPAAACATVLAAAMEVRKPSILGELIIALTFVPIITLQGLEGKMFSPLAFTVAIALLSSLLLSIFVIPVLCLVLLKAETKESPVLRAIRRVYLPALDWTLGHRARGARRRRRARVRRAGAGAAPRHRVPADHGRGRVRHGRPDAARRLARQGARRRRWRSQKRLKRFPELQTVVSRTGQTGVAIEARGVDKTGFVGALKPRVRVDERVDAARS